MCKKIFLEVVNMTTSSADSDENFIKNKDISVSVVFFKMNDEILQDLTELCELRGITITAGISVAVALQDKH